MGGRGRRVLSDQAQEVRALRSKGGTGVGLKLKGCCGARAGWAWYWGPTQRPNYARLSWWSLRLGGIRAYFDWVWAFWAIAHANGARPQPAESLRLPAPSAACQAGGERCGQAGGKAGRSFASEQVPVGAALLAAAAAAQRTGCCCARELWDWAASATPAALT